VHANIDKHELDEAHISLLKNCDEVQPFLELVLSLQYHSFFLEILVYLNNLQLK